MNDMNPAINTVSEILRKLTVITVAKNEIDGTETATGLMDELYGQMKAYDGTIHKFWNDVYEANGWSFREFDHVEDKMVTYEGSKAPAKVQTYKSQSRKAYVKSHKAGDDKFQTMERWTDLKAYIAAEKSAFRVRQDAAFKALKELLKEAEKAGDGTLLETLEGLANN